jgi:uncharacterized protein (UPF0264 family)
MNAADAAAALAGGADIIDAKDPAAGALGAVSIEMFRQIHALVAGQRPVSAALGDASDARVVEQQAAAFARAGAAFVKVGFAGLANEATIAALLRAAGRGVQSVGRSTQVVAVAYADGDRVNAPGIAAITTAAVRASVGGVLIDTADKAGPGLTAILSPNEIEQWVTVAHEARLWVAVAGKLSEADLESVAGSGADIAGVRGAACIAGRSGFVTATRVNTLRARCGADRLLARPSP